MKRILRNGLYVCYVLLIVYAMLYFGFWTTYKQALFHKQSPESARERLNPPRHIDAATMRLLGSVDQSKTSSFVNFEQAKAAGNIRVCALGDSNTQGDEVGVRHDYPAYLQRLFERRGFNRVEVLNFGNGWFGFSQIYVMWKNVARKFDCDFVLLFPMVYWMARDDTFNHTQGRYPAYLHARLVLEKDRLQLIAPIGTTAEERFQEYVRPIPHRQYRRYDRHPPNILNSPLPDSNNVPNPFYYDPRQPVEEFEDIYARIIRDIADDGVQLIVMFRGGHQDLYPGIIPARTVDIGVGLLREKWRFPYKAPKGHPSAWEHEVTAMAFFELLTGGTRVDYSVATIEDNTASTAGTPKALHGYQQVWLEYQGERIGYFVNKKASKHSVHLGTFRRQGIAAILSLEKSGGNIAEACLLPLKDVPANNAELVYERDNGELDHLSFGVVHQIQPNVAIFKATVPPSGYNLQCLPKNLDENTKSIGDGRLILHGVTIARVEGERIKPEYSVMLKLSESGEHLASIDSLNTPSEMDIVLKHDDGTVIRRPLLKVRSQVWQNYLEIKLPIKNVIISELGGS